MSETCRLHYMDLCFYFVYYNNYFIICFILFYFILVCLGSECVLQYPLLIAVNLQAFINDKCDKRRGHLRIDRNFCLVHE
jgi:hypothetical protein